MTVRRKMLLGTIGAITPLALNLLVVDHLTLTGLTMLTSVGYVIRVIALTGLGGLVVLLNIDEDHPMRIFQLGLAAPVLVTDILNGVNQRTLLETQEFARPSSAAVFSLPVVYAEPPVRARQFVIPKETQGEQVWRGLTGSRSDRVWFVIARREPTSEAASTSADRINQTFYGFRAEVYQPYQGRGSWSVVIGEGLIRADAMRLRERAVTAGMPDAELWTPPPDGAQR